MVLCVPRNSSQDLSSARPNRLPRVGEALAVMAFLTQVDPLLPPSGYLVSRAAHAVMGRTALRLSLWSWRTLRVMGQGTS